MTAENNFSARLRVVSVAIACCSECLTGYDVIEWRQLDLVEEKHEGLGGMMSEVRLCAQCDNRVFAMVDDLPTCGIWMNEGHHRDIFPTSARPETHGHQEAEPEPVRVSIGAPSWMRPARVFAAAFLAVTFAPVTVAAVEQWIALMGWGP